MKNIINPKTFANASSLVTLVVYIICRAVSLIAPDFLFGLSKSWFHTLSIDSLKGASPMDLGTFLIGGVSLAVLVWIITYSTIALYNHWAK